MQDKAKRPRVAVVIVKVTSSCNHACKYCYAMDQAREEPDQRMSYDILREVIRQFSKIEAPVVRYIWHGGEPLLVGMDFYEQAVALQAFYHDKGVTVRNSIQTNGSLLNSSWAAFFAAHGFNVGVSLDGPREIHNEVRRLRTGAGSHDDVMQGIKLLASHYVPHGLLAVVSRCSLNHASDIFDFFLSNGLMHYELLPVAPEFVNGSREPPSYSITPIEYARFMIQVFDRWLEQDDPGIRIRFFDNAMAGLLGGHPSTCTFAGTCSQYLTIAPNGDVYHCDWFIGQKEKCFGNICCGDLATTMDCARYREYVADIKRPKPECQNCIWKPICNGGCTYHRSIPGDSHSPYYFCESRKLIFAHMNRRLQSVLVDLGVTDRPQWVE